MDDFERWRHEVDRRLDALEAAKSKVRKPVDTANARAINLRQIGSVVDGEMFSFVGKFFYEEAKGKGTKCGFAPLDAERGEKAGAFMMCWEALPTWLQKGMTVECVAQCKAKPPYMNYSILSWKRPGQTTTVCPPTYDDPAMQYQAPLDDVPPRTPQTFVSDEEAGVDPESIPF